MSEQLHWFLCIYNESSRYFLLFTGVDILKHWQVNLWQESPCPMRKRFGAIALHFLPLYERQRICFLLKTKHTFTSLCICIFIYVCMCVYICIYILWINKDVPRNGGVILFGSSVYNLWRHLQGSDTNVLTFSSAVLRVPNSFISPMLVIF